MSILKGAPTPLFELGTVTYDNVSFNVGNQDGSPQSLAFNNNGSKMFVLAFSTNIIYQYTLSTAFEIGTSSYDNVSFNVGSQDISPTGLAFNNNGSKMFIVGRNTDSVYQYTLSTEFNVGTASYDNVSFDVSSQENSPRGLTFNNDGSKMFVVGDSSDSVLQYTLSTAFNVGSASYDNVSFSVGSQDGAPRDLTFNNDGTKMLIIGRNTDRVYQYTLSIAFNVENASYDNVSFSISSQETSPEDLTFNNDGSKMFVVGGDSDSVHQYTNVTSIQYPAIQNIYYGQPENYLSFDGVDDYVELFTWQDNIINIEFEMKRDGLPSDREWIINNYNIGSPINWFGITFNENGIMQFALDDGSTQTRTDYDITSILDNEWHKIRFYYNPNTNTKALYIDGNEAFNVTYTGNVTLNQNPIFLGKLVDFNVEFYEGGLKNFRFWNINTSSNMSQELTGNETGLVAYYKFNEGSGTTLNDTAGNNDGTIVGATWGSEQDKVSRVYLGGALVYQQAPISYEFIGSFEDPNNNSSFSFTIPPVEPGLIVVAVAVEGAFNINNFTIDGVSANLAVKDSNSRITFIYYLETTSNISSIDYSLGGNVARSAIGVYRIINYNSSTPYITKDSGFGSNRTLTFANVSVDEKSVGIFNRTEGNPMSVNWVGANEDYDTTTSANNSTFSSASKFFENSGNYTISSTLTGSATGTAMVGAFWK